MLTKYTPNLPANVFFPPLKGTTMAVGFHSFALPFYRDIKASFFVEFLVIYKLTVYQILQESLVI